MLNFKKTRLLRDTKGSTTQKKTSFIHPYLYCGQFPTAHMGHNELPKLCNGHSFGTVQNLCVHSSLHGSTFREHLEELATYTWTSVAVSDKHWLMYTSRADGLCCSVTRF